MDILNTFLSKSSTMHIVDDWNDEKMEIPYFVYN